MGPYSPGLLLAAGAFAAAVAAAITFTLARWTRRQPMGPLAREEGARAIFLFEGGDLVDASPAARRLVGG